MHLKERIKREKRGPFFHLHPCQLPQLLKTLQLHSLLLTCLLPGNWTSSSEPLPPFSHMGIPSRAFCFLSWPDSITYEMPVRHSFDFHILTEEKVDCQSWQKSCYNLSQRSPHLEINQSSAPQGHQRRREKIQQSVRTYSCYQEPEIRTTDTIKNTLWIKRQGLSKTSTWILEANLWLSW